MSGMKQIKQSYEAPESILLCFPAENAICVTSDKAGEDMEEGEYWYEY